MMEYDSRGAALRGAARAVCVGVWLAERNCARAAKGGLGLVGFRIYYGSSSLLVATGAVAAPVRAGAREVLRPLATMEGAAAAAAPAPTPAASGASAAVDDWPVADDFLLRVAG